MKKAIIIGHHGQDGQLLYDFLLHKGYMLIGIERECVSGTDNNWHEPVDISDAKAVFKIVNDIKPHEIYHLAAHHHSSEDKLTDNIQLIQESYKVNVISLINFLEAIRFFSPATRLFYAASSHIFAEADGRSQDENTVINPNSIYGITKAAGLFTCRFYRNSYSLFASVGILYNHESSLRSNKFVSKKIIEGALNIKAKKQEKLILGNLQAQIDWGYAPDYVNAMFKILNIQKPDDFVIATGEKHTVLDFVKNVFTQLDLDWKLYVEERKDIIADKNICRIGNPEKLMKNTGWKPSVDFKEMVRQLLIAEKQGIK